VRFSVDDVGRFCGEIALELYFGYDLKIQPPTKSKVLNHSHTKDKMKNTKVHYPSTFELPVLYTTTKASKEQFWKVYAEDNTVHTHWGVVGGKPQHHPHTFEGKANTTANEQAKQEAEKKWVKQLTKGYTPKCKEGLKMMEDVKRVSEKSGGHNINASTAIRQRQEKTTKDRDCFVVGKVVVVIKPMKANVLELVGKTLAPKVAKYFNFKDGVFMQAKLDGCRCAARLQGKDVVLTSNSGKEFPWFVAIRKAVAALLSKGGYLDGLDGEIYVHTMLDENGAEMNQDARFHFIQGACGIARSNPEPREDQLQLHVFDLVDVSGKVPQHERFKMLDELFAKNTSDKLVKVEYRKGNSMEDIFDYHDEMALQTYEGVMVRSFDLPYSQNRSLKLRKYKHFQDAEYRIKGVKKDRGLEDENFVWVCETNGKTFNVKPGGSIQDRRDYYQNYVTYVGKWLTVKYQNLSEDGIPRFGVGKGIRDDVVC